MTAMVVDIYICCIIAVILRIFFKDNLTYLIASGVGGMVYGIIKGMSK